MLSRIGDSDFCGSRTLENLGNQRNLDSRFKYVLGFHTVSAQLGHMGQSAACGVSVGPLSGSANPRR